MNIEAMNDFGSEEMTLKAIKAIYRLFYEHWALEQKTRREENQLVAFFVILEYF